MKLYTSIIVFLRHMCFLLLFFLVGFCQSCDDYVDVALPNSQLTGVTVFEDVTTANAALAGLYAKLRTGGVFAGGTGMTYYLGLYADELDHYQITTLNNFHTNTLVPGESGVSSVWNLSYRQIYEANALLEGVNGSVSLAEADRNQIKGEALFIRAIVHFYLVNIFGDVPYVKSTDYEKNTQIARLATSVVYQEIVTDLTESSTLLGDDYVSAERVRPNRLAVQAFLARVYLNMGAYAASANAASAVINSPLYVWETDLNQVFLKGSTTTIWQFMPNAAGNNTSEGSTYIFTAGPPSNVALTPSLVNAFELNDLRKQKWIKAVTNGNSTWYHSFKYKQKTNTAASVEYSVVLRLAEQYLIRAEARARQGELTNAKSDLNLIRMRAGIGPTAAVTAEELIADVMQQRRLELFTEFGHRFFDLRRNNALDSVLSATKPGWNTTDQFWPLPERELEANPKLKPQNPGY